MKRKFQEVMTQIYQKALKNKTISIILLLCVAYGAYALFFKTSTTAVTYQYTTVKRGSLQSTVSGTGQVISNSQVDLKPKVNANVTGVYVKAGDRVKQGQVLFRLDATDAYRQVRDAKTSLEAANLALLKLQNPKTIDVMSINDSIKQEEESKKSEDQKVTTAYQSLLNSNLQVIPEGAYTTETAPTLSGSYTKTDEGQIKLSVYQGGETGYSFSASGIASGIGQVNTIVAQPIGDTGLYIKWNTSNPQTNWIINIPNKESSSYSSNYTSLQNAISNRDTANAQSDRTIADLKQKLADLTPGDDNLDVQSAKLTITQRQNALSDAEQTLSNYTITAPFDGVMASVSVDIGASAVMASANTSAALGTIVTDKKLAQITVNETDITKVHLGQKATMTFDAIDGLEAEGEVVEVNTLGVVTSGVVTYKIKLAFNTDDPRILPNMSVSADIVTDSKDDVLYIPSQALKHDTNGYYVEEDGSSPSYTQTGTSSRRFANGSSTSFTASSTLGTGSTTRRFRNGSSTYQRTGTTSGTVSATLKRVPVTIGIQNDTQTEIVSGLSEGERIILKKSTTTTKSGTTTTAPSVTSLLRPQGANRPAGAAGARAQ